jgi:hypothetical protein
MVRIFALFATVIALATSAMGQQVRLVWDANSEADLAGYRVYRSTAAGSGHQQIGSIPCSGGNAACATFTDTDGLVYATTYYYVVTAVNTSGLESGYSNQVSAFVPNPEPPAAPTGLQVAESGVNVSARWSPVEGVDYYAIFYRPAGGSFGLLEVVSGNTWSGRLPPPGQRKGAELGVASLDAGGYSALATYAFR